MSASFRSALSFHSLAGRSLAALVVAAASGAASAAFEPSVTSSGLGTLIRFIEDLLAMFGG